MSLAIATAIAVSQRVTSQNLGGLFSRNAAVPS
jgi:hypothetical protein